MLGFLNIYKPTNMTSNAVVQKIKKHFHIDKIGHMGTLDPMASGILPLAIGKATRLFDYMLEKVKKYKVTYAFGYETDTLDSTGNVINNSQIIPSKDQVLKVINAMIGVQDQIPPKYSAKNVNGRRAYDLARSGMEFYLKPKQIEIYNIELLNSSSNKYSFNITCSSGTYIRAIGRDIAYKLNTFATMTALERYETGCFGLGTAINLDDLLKLDTLENILISPIDVFKNYDHIKVDLDQYKDLKDGKKIKYNVLKNNAFIIFDGQVVGVTKSGKDYLKFDTFLGE